jgi:hypothetical protein
LDALADLISKIPDVNVVDPIVRDPMDDLADQIFAHGEWTELDALVEAIWDTPILVGRARNATSNFLDKRLRETGGMTGSFMAHLRAAVAYHLPVSRTVGIIEDHVQNCFLRLISRDSLAKRLADGYTITNAQVALFAVRAGYTDIRDSGTDPVCREMYGARTEREREKGVVTMPITDPRIVWAQPDDENAGTWVDIADNDTNQEDVLNFADIWQRLEDTIRKHKPNAADRYIEILRAKAQGSSINDIADTEDVSPFRAASMMAEIRRVLRSEGLDDLNGLNGLN